MDKFIFNSEIFKSKNYIYLTPNNEPANVVYGIMLEEVSFNEIIKRIEEYTDMFYQEPSVVFIPDSFRLELSCRNIFPYKTEYDILMSEIDKKFKVIFYAECF